MSTTHLIGIFTTTDGKGCEAVCGQCNLPVKRKTERGVKSAMTSHYEAQHPELSLRFKRYDQER